MRAGNIIALAAVLDYTNAIVYNYDNEITAFWRAPAGEAMRQPLSDKFWEWMVHTSHWTETNAYTSASAGYNP